MRGPVATKQELLVIARPHRNKYCWVYVATCKGRSRVNTPEITTRCERHKSPKAYYMFERPRNPYIVRIQPIPVSET